MRDNASFVRIVLGIGAAVALGAVGLALVGTLGCWLGGGAFVNFGIRTDIDDYTLWVEQSDLRDPDRSEILDRLSRIAGDVDSGSISVPFFAWIDIDSEIEDRIEDRQITSGELSGLHDQLNRIESYRR